MSDEKFSDEKINEEEESPSSLAVQFLFDISKEVKHFYETPVIFLTKKDYSDTVFNTMCQIRKIFQGSTHSVQSEVIDNIVDFHLAWLHAVNEIENFKKGIETLDRDDVYEAITFTMTAMSVRLKYYLRYMESNLPFLSNVEHSNLQAEIEIVEEMHKDVMDMLSEKLKCFKNYVDFEEFKVKVKDAEDELLHWLDKINDGLAMQLSKYINLNIPQLTGDLTKTLQQIVDEFKTSESPMAVKMLEELKERGRELSTMIRCTATRNLEISKVLEKISILDERIERLENEPSSAALMALHHKKDFLERRLVSLENLKTTLKSLKEDTDVNFESVPDEELCVCEDFFQLRIFNHLLPAVERERLVTELCFLWDQAVFGSKSHKSIISILSAAEMKEEFTDDLGIFFIDDYGRKIYKMLDEDTLYQANELNELVPLADDAEHTYFYDECGRYFIDPKTRQRIYKAHATASEYMLDTTGILLKVKEERDGVTYFYDNFGRYYIDNEGRHVYREEDATSEYENDGLGNLVRLRSQPDIFDECPEDVCVTEDFRYLKHAVGPALRVCVAECIMHQPADPIKYLSTRLLKYRENVEIRDRRAREREELEIEREVIRAEERAAAERAAMEAALLAQGGSEASYDSNLLNYTTSMAEDEHVAASAN